MNIIVNVDKNWAIGNKGALLFPISADLKNFRRLTEHHVVIMGRSTLESLPGGKPLKNRMNIVLSSTVEASQVPPPPDGSNLFICRSVSQLQNMLQKAPFSTFPSGDFFVIGGQRVYTQLLPLCNTAYVTQVDAAAPVADAFFPNLSADANWRVTEKSDVQMQGELAYYFVRYERVSPCADILV